MLPSLTTPSFVDSTDSLSASSLIWKDIRIRNHTQVICGRYNNTRQESNTHLTWLAAESRRCSMYSYYDLSKTGSGIYFFCGLAMICTEGPLLLQFFVKYHRCISRILTDFLFKFGLYVVLRQNINTLLCMEIYKHQYIKHQYIPI